MISGTAVDDVAVSNVQLALQRRSDGSWFDGNSFQISQTPPYAIAGRRGRHRRRRVEPIRPAAALNSGSSRTINAYTVVARSTDTAGNVQSVFNARHLVASSLCIGRTANDGHPGIAVAERVLPAGQHRRKRDRHALARFGQRSGHAGLGREARADPPLLPLLGRDFDILLGWRDDSSNTASPPRPPGRASTTRRARGRIRSTSSGRPTRAMPCCSKAAARIKPLWATGRARAISSRRVTPGVNGREYLQPRLRRADRRRSSLPAPNAKMQQLSTTISGTSADDLSGVATLAIEISSGTGALSYWNGGAWTPAQTWNPVGLVNPWTYSAPALVTGKDYYLRLQVTDAANNVYTTPVSTFTYDTTAPTVTMAAPVAGKLFRRAASPPRSPAPRPTRAPIRRASAR